MPQFDSVFTAALEPPFPNDRPLIPIAEIERGLDAIEQASVEQQTNILAEQTDALLQRAGVFLSAGDVSGIQSLTWKAGIALQSPLFSVWSLGWQLGSAHMIREMIAAVPEQLKFTGVSKLPFGSFSPTFVNQSFATAQEKDAIAQLLQLQPGTIVNTAAEQAVLRRTIQLAGKFSEDQLAKLKVSLIGAISPDGQGKVLSRKELLDQIQTTLNVGKVRAQMISRTELTSAYNSSRVQTAMQSSIVTHFRFLGLADSRQSEICKSRNGLIIPVTDQAAIAANKPALHVRCRSVLSAVLGTINPTHQEWIADPDRQLENRTLEPLPKGWQTDALPKVPLKAAPEIKPKAVPTPLKATQPVSAALTIGRGSKPIKAEVQHALDAIDSVHTDGELPAIPIKVTVGKKGTEASFSYRRIEGKIAAEWIQVSSKNTTETAFSLTHEVGHFLDSQVLHSAEKVGYASASDPALAAWRQAIGESRAAKRLDEIAASRTVKAWSRERNAFIEKPVDRSYVAYLLSPHELFARSYSQYIAVRSESAIMLGQMAPYQGKTAATVLYPSQWEDDDFAPIAAALDDLFRSKGWLT